MSRTRTRTRRMARTGRTRTAEPIAEPGAAAPLLTDPFAAFLARTAAWVLAVGGALGTAAAFALVLDRIALLEDPEFVPSCSISPLLSCGSVMTSPQAEVFGFPNPLIGLVAFPVVMTVGAVALAGGRIPRGVWLAVQAGTLAGVVFVHWLISASLYSIGALCPYCMAVWIVTITMFCYTTVHNVTAGQLPLPAAWRRPAAALARYHGMLLTSWFLLIAALVTARFLPLWTAPAA